MAQRPQVNTDLGQPEALRTVARPSMDRAPVHTLQQSRAGALAQSLVSIAPKLSGFVDEFQQDYQEEEANRAYDQIQGMTYEEAQAAVKSGTMRDTESPWYQAAFEKQFGTVYAAKRRRELVDRYNNEFDKHNGDLDTFLAEFAGEDLDKFGGSQFIMSGYRNGMAGSLGQLRDNHAEWKSSWTKERVQENFGSIAYDRVTQTVSEGGDLNEVLGAMKGENREAFGATYAEQDAGIFGVAERLAAEGNVEALEQLLTLEQVGPDGTVIGSYMNRPRYATQAAKLLETAKATAGEKMREENTATVVGLQQQAASGQLDIDLATTMRDQEQISLGEYERLIGANETAQVKATTAAQVAQYTDTLKTEALKAVTSGNAYAVRDVTLTDATGKTHTFTRDELIEGAVVDSLDVMASNGATPALMAEQLSSYGVDVTYPAWENLMSDGYLPLTENLATPDKDGNITLPDTALKAYATYKALNETPNLRSRHINNRDAEDVWSAASLLEQNGYSVEDALLRAAAPVTEAGKAAANSFQRAEFTALADSIQPGVLGEDVANGAAALGQTEALAKFFIARGVPRKQAVKQAISDYQGSHTNINGASINTRNVYLPQNFEDASLVVLQDFAEEHDEDVDDLTLIPALDESNNWIIATKGNTAMPVQVMGGDNRIHVSQIERRYQDVLEEEAQAAFEAAEAEIAAEGERQAVIDQTEADYAAWQQMSRSERKAAGLPVSTVGGQNHFSVNRALRKHRQEQRGAEVVEQKQNARELMQSDEADAIFQQMGIVDPFER